MTQRITSASFSRLAIFDTCPFRAKLAYLERVPEPVRPPLPEGKEYANDRGTRIHSLAQDFVTNQLGSTLPVELTNFASEFHRARELFIADSSSVIAENMWLFDTGWDVLPMDVPSTDIGIRVIVDLCYLHADRPKALIIDHKTGKRFGNEIKHNHQTQFYAVSTAMRYLEVEEFETELWYLDVNELDRKTYTRAQVLRFLKYWNDRINAMLDATVFPCKANSYSCFYCPYKTGLIGKNGPEGTGDCKRNVV